MSSIPLPFLKRISRPEISTTLQPTLKNKKALNWRFFVKNFSMEEFWQKMIKWFFFENLIEFVKNVARRIFDKGTHFLSGQIYTPPSNFPKKKGDILLTFFKFPIEKKRYFWRKIKKIFSASRKTRGYSEEGG